MLSQVVSIVDKFIRDAQLNAIWYNKVIEWIPYNKFKNIKEIAKGGFGSVYYAKWIDGYIERWDIKKNNGIETMTIHLKILNSFYSIRIYGITKDPETDKYIMVLEYMPDGNLRDYLKNHFDNINWND
ncbi:hypothetical protein Glove_21g76 [Diversispora epigaea]|uniref:Protein kinase domain-containing protein n=1 Tax=Diversispora epigaea TaxID=1348612 RepID=A0A397JVD8_9GLOM|nr:hypothetical protein Glove_21g76 [Diversispora epigaea]